MSKFSDFFPVSTGPVSTGSSVEWSQEYYDSIFQESLNAYPSEYLAIPEPESTEQICYILVAVFDSESNFTAFTCAGDYTVDWGDGTVENFTSGTKAEHEYNYSNLTLNSDTVSSFGHKQTMITITMQAGQTLTSLNFDQNHSLMGSINQPFLAISIAGLNLSSLTLAQFRTYANFYNLKYFRLESNSITDMNYMFYYCSSLTTIPLLNTSSVTNMNGVFKYCFSLTAIPLLNTSSVTDMTSMFQSCFTLTTIPLLDTSSVTNMSSMFYYCYSLTTIPLLDTSSVTNMSSMFNKCQSLTAIPLLDTSNVTNMSSMLGSCFTLTAIPLLDTSNVTNMSIMLSSCTSLTTIPLLNTSSVTDMSTMFSSCYSLTTIPLLDTSNVTNMNSIFSNCYSLTTIPLLDTSSVTNMSNIFQNCYSLTTIPLLDTSNVTNMSLMFYYCYSLTAIPLLDTSNVTNMSSMFNNSTSLKRISISIKYTNNISNFKLSSNALNEIYTNLPTKTGQTLTVTGNWGTAGDDPSIATAKGWTITG